MEQAKQAIEAAYAKQIGTLFQAFAAALTMADGDEAQIEDAQAKFSAGVRHTDDARSRALALIPD